MDLVKFKHNKYIVNNSEELTLKYKGTKGTKFSEVLIFEIKKPDIKFNVHIKAVLFDDAIFEVEAILKVLKGATQSNTYVKIDCLIMSEKVQTKIIPSLEILEDAVKSGHGATISTLDEEQVYYLASRGLTRSQAEKLIIDGFLS